MDYYAVLGVRPGAPRAEIESAYERLAQEYQPDLNAEPLFPERLHELDQAFDLLDDPVRRAEYDLTHNITAVVPTDEPTMARSSRTIPLAPLGLITAGVVAVGAAVVVLLAVLLDDDPQSIVTLASGLSYQDIKQGDGDPPRPGNYVVLHYRGTLLDGTVFDESYDVPEEPFFFELGTPQVLPSLQEGVSTMRAGGKRLLTIPPQSATGDPHLPAIPPDVQTTMEVELLEIVRTGEEITLPNGLKYVDIEPGFGPFPRDGQRVSVHYTGTFEDGRVFDQTVDPDKPTAAPYEFILGSDSEIRGFDDGIRSMRVGTLRKLIIPPALAYGEEGFGTKVPPNATLIFEVKLVGIVQ